MLNTIKLKLDDGLKIESHWGATMWGEAILEDENRLVSLSVGDLTATFLNNDVVDYCDIITDIDDALRDVREHITDRELNATEFIEPLDEDDLFEITHLWSRAAHNIEKEYKKLDQFRETAINEIDKAFFISDVIQSIISMIKRIVNEANKELNYDLSDVVVNLSKGMSYLSDIVEKYYKSVVRFKYIGCKVYGIDKNFLYPKAINTEGAITIYKPSERGSFYEAEDDEADNDEYPITVKISRDSFIKYIEGTMKYSLNIQRILEKEGDQFIWKDEYVISDIMDILMNDLQACMNANHIIKHCDNCGKYFIPISRSDEKYCDNFFKDTGKTCRQTGAQLRYEQKLEGNPIMLERRKFYRQLHSSTVKPKRGIHRDKAREKLASLMDEVDKEIERINNAPDQEKQRLTDYLMTWMNHKRSELMPRKKAK